MRLPSAARPPAIGSDEWREEYGRRLDRMLKALRKRGMVVYFVGQPVLRNSSAAAQAEMINEVMRQRATANGVRFIDIFAAFQDDGGGFSQFGPDISGNRVKLREGDGVTFTPTGYRQLAHFVDKEMRRDIDQAAADRAIPLAGDDAEQRRVNPGKQAAGGRHDGMEGRGYRRRATDCAAASSGGAGRPSIRAVTRRPTTAASRSARSEAAVARRR